MNLLKNVTGVLNQAIGGEVARGGYLGIDGRDPASSRGRRPQRVYTPAEQQTMADMQFRLNRMTTLTLPVDRRATMEELTQLVRDHPDLPAVRDDAGLRTLIDLANSIQQDRQDELNIDISLQAIEILKILLAPSSSQANDDANGSSTVVASSNATLVSLFVSHPAYIPSLLELLEEKQARLRLYTMECLTSLLLARTEKVQELVVKHPQGVIIVIGLLSDAHEMIRNQALLLLEVLTRKNPTIQNIIAFNGGFDHLLSIAADEFRADSIIAVDAMRLVSSLLQDHPGNQFFFPQLGCVNRLLPYLTFSEADLREDATGANFEFLCLTLEILNHVVACLDYSNPSAAKKNADTRNSLGLLIHPLMKLACAQHQAAPPVAIRHDCWSLLAHIVDSHARNQAILEEYRVELIVSYAPPVPAAVPTMIQQLQYPDQPYDPHHNPYITVAVPPPAQQPVAPTWKKVRRAALRHVLELACDAADAAERFLLLHLLRAYFAENSSAQLKAMMSFTPSPVAIRRQPQSPGSSLPVEDEDEGGPIVGPTLVLMLDGSRPQMADYTPGPEGASYVDRCRWVASQVLQAMLRGNPDAQVMLLTTPLTDGHSAADTGGADSARLIEYYIKALFSSQNHGEAELALLALLCTWADGCLDLNEKVFDKYATSLLAYLIQMAKDPNVHLTARGLATYYLALVLELMSNPPASQPSKSSRNNDIHGTVVASPAFSSSIITAATLRDLITREVTVETFKANLDALRASVYYTQAHALTNGKLANPLTLTRQFEGEWMQKMLGTGLQTPNTPAVEAAAAELTPEQEAQRDAFVITRLHESLLLTHAFTARFKTVDEKCTDRLLNLALNTSAPPVAISSAAVANGTFSTLAVPSTNGHALSPSISPALSPMPQHAAAAATAREQQLLDENQRLKAELQALKAQQQQPNGTATGAAACPLCAQRQQELAELKSEHEDLLILLASQEIELEQARGGAAATALNAPAVVTSPVRSAASAPAPAIPTKAPVSRAASPTPTTTSHAVQPTAPPQRSRAASPVPMQHTFADGTPSTAAPSPAAATTTTAAPSASAFVPTYAFSPAAVPSSAASASAAPAATPTSATITSVPAPSPFNALSITTSPAFSQHHATSPQNASANELDLR